MRGFVMAIQFARMRIITRSSGGNVVRSAAYNARSNSHSERTGESFYFTHRDGHVHHELILPDNAPDALNDANALWNAAQAAEKRVNSQEAKELLLALPADEAVSADMRAEMVRGFLKENFGPSNLAMQVDIHSPHEGDKNHHAHVLISTRELGPDGFGAKVRSLNGQFARGQMIDGERWGEVWRDYQNSYFTAHDLDLRVADISIVPGEHIGPQRMRTEADVEAIQRNKQRSQVAHELIQDPGSLLDHLTRHQSWFGADDLNRVIDKYDFEEKDAADIFKRVLHDARLLYSIDDHGELDARFTTIDIRDVEAKTMALAGAIRDEKRSATVGLTGASLAVKNEHLSESDSASFGGPEIPLENQANLAADLTQKYGLFDEQAEAVSRILLTPGFAMLRGRAGTGKSFALSALRTELEASGRDVVGLAPTNIVAASLRDDGFEKASTVASFLFRAANGKLALQEGTQLIVDEAAMLDSRSLKGLLEIAYANKASVLLVGDDGQLSSIERGGLFKNLAERYGVNDLVDVRRQKADWARQATQDLARGDMKSALQTYADRGALHAAKTQADAKAALVAKWSKDLDRDPSADRFIFARLNKDVDALNAAARAHLRLRGDLRGADIRVETKDGAYDFAVGDKVLFTSTDKRKGLMNGVGGVITEISGEHMVVNDDGTERVVEFAQFNGVRHGYAGTIYKGQGRTVDHAYVLHDKDWGRSSAYVAMSRHRDAADLFVSGRFGNVDALARRLRRDDRKIASLDMVVSDPNAPGKAFEFNAEGLVDNHEWYLKEVRAAMRVKQQQAYEDRYRKRGSAAQKGAKEGWKDNKRGQVLYDFAAGVTAVEIEGSAQATQVARKRGLIRGVTQYALSVRRAVKDFKRSSRLVVRGIRMGLGIH